MPRVHWSIPDSVGMLIASIPRPLGFPSVTEERSYAVRIAAGGEDGREAAAELVVRNIPLAIRIAKGYSRNPIYARFSFPDLTAAGCLGLIRAVRQFDGRRNRRFSTYASRWIRSEIRNWILSDRLVYIPKYLQDAMRYGRFDPSHSRTPKFTELCQKTGAIAIAAEVVYDSDDIPPAERWIDPESDSDPVVAIEDSDEHDQLYEWVARLHDINGRLSNIIELKYGLSMPDRKPLTTVEIARRLGISRERAKKLEEDALAILREIAGI